jgi:hypothetical protein
MLEKNSALRKLPGNLDEKQTLFLDGVRLAVEMAYLAYDRLSATLRQLPTSREPSTSRRNTVSALQDVWSLVDSIDRLRTLLLAFPRMPVRKPQEVSQFLAATSIVRDLRNRVQHMDRFIPRFLSKRKPLWGELSWFCLLDDGGQKRAFMCSLVAGTFNPTDPRRLTLPAAVPTTASTELIVLHVESLAVSISDLMSTVDTFVRWIEQVLAEQFSVVPLTTPLRPADVFLAAEVDLVEFGKFLDQHAGGGPGSSEP